MDYTLMTAFGMLFIFIMTTLGSLVVVFFKGTISQKCNSIFLGFASGIMIAASVWSLIIPAIDMSHSWGKLAFLPAVVGIVLGSLFIIILGKLIPIERDVEASVERHKTAKLFVAVTVHNIPEGLSVGFAFGVASVLGTEEAYILAIGLSIGVGLQNFPEGTALALPIKSVTGSRMKGFLGGTASGVVEPIFAIIGYFLASYLTYAQPWLLSFAAGAMLYVVAEELLPDGHIEEKPYIVAISFVIGFIIMMTMDVALG